jgi:UV DNA damage endonuclease
MVNLGYACINSSLRKQKIFAGRTCRKDRFKREGLQYVGDLGIQNLRDLYKIVQWNERNGIKFYRIGSDIFPWSSEYEYSDLPQYKEACTLLKAIGDYATKVGQRLTFHPGPFNILGSQKDGVVERTIVDLRHHSEIFDLMGFEPSVYNKINIHVGAAYKDKYAVLKKWCESFKRLDEGLKKRLTIENDDKTSLYTVADLYRHIHQEVGIPIVFDYHHHSCHPGDLLHYEALGIAVKTWPAGIKPVVHFSSSRQIEDPKAKVQAHADYIYGDIDTFGYDVDIMLEVKQKEKALLEYRKKSSILI